MNYVPLLLFCWIDDPPKDFTQYIFVLTGSSKITLLVRSQVANIPSKYH